MAARAYWKGSLKPTARRSGRVLRGAIAQSELSFSPRHCEERKRRSNPYHARL